MARLGFSLTTGLTSGTSASNPVALPLIPVGFPPVLTSIVNGTSRNDSINISNVGIAPTIIDARGGADQIALNPFARDRVGYPFLSNVAFGPNLNTSVAGISVTQDVISGFQTRNEEGTFQDEILIDPRSFGFNLTPDVGGSVSSAFPIGGSSFVLFQFVEVTNLLAVNSPASIAAVVGDQGDDIPLGNRTLVLTYAAGIAPGTVDAFINIHQSLDGDDDVEADEIVAGLIRIQNVGIAGSLTVNVFPLGVIPPLFSGVGLLAFDINVGNFSLV
jgi:hypothetical protein